MSYVKSVSGSDYRFLVWGVMLYHTCPRLNLLNGPLMFKRRYVTLLPLFVLLAACSSKPKPTETETTTGTPSGGFLLEPQHNVMQMGGDFANNPNAQQFIDKMVNKHGFDRQQLQEILSRAKRLDSVLRLMDNRGTNHIGETAIRSERRMAALSQKIYYAGQRAERCGFLESV